MRMVNLYRYNGDDGSITVTPHRRSDTDRVYAYRLIAGDGCMLTDGANEVYCVDTHESNLWREVMKHDSDYC